MPSLRLSFVLVALVSALSIVAALIMQHKYDMEPCPLCISQRIFIIAVGMMALLGAILSGNKIGTRISASLGVISAIIGASISTRHVWIQNLPEDEVPTCGPGLSYMFETRPVFDALSLLFSGDGHCAEVNFTFLGLSIPGWTLILFIGLGSAMAFQFWRSLKENN